VRVVSLNCSNTEIVCALGCAEQLVGVDADSDWPAEVVARLPRVGRDLDIDVEQVAALRPDLVLASLTVPGHEDVVAGLERAGLPFLAPRTRSLADVYTDIRAIAARLSVAERGEQVVEAMREVVEAPPVAADPAPRVLVEWWPKPVIAPALRSWVHDLLEHAGAVDPLADRDAESVPLTDEDAAALRPDVVVISWCGVRTEKYRTDVVYRRTGWEGVPAVRDGRVHLVPEAFLGRPGPRLADGSRALRALVQEFARGR
jgi:iron complex transport system substrate-binding protein